MYRLACSMLGSTDQADDVTQDAFVALYQSPIAFESDDHRRNWLLKVAANQCRNIIRDRKRHPSLNLDEAHRAVDRANHRAFERAEHDRDQSMVLWEHVDRLPLDLREVVHLRYGEDLDTKSIAAICGISVGAAHVRLFRSRTRLRESLEGGDR